MKKLTWTLVMIPFIMACTSNMNRSGVSQDIVERLMDSLSVKDGRNIGMIERGVKQAAGLWQETDGTGDDFMAFCLNNYLSDPAEKKDVFLRISDYLEAVNGHFNEMSRRLQRHIHEATGPLYPVDELFAAYSPEAHFTDDLYANKIAFLIALNFPELSLPEKEALGRDRLAWAYARLGDLFTARVPANVKQKVAAAASDADVYIAGYNIYAGHLLGREEKQLFPQDMVLLAHWNLRDEIKANYNKGDEGLEKQRAIYEVMKRIVAQDIPKEVINSSDYEWNPYTNILYREGKQVEGTPEGSVRYEKFLNNFKVQRAVDSYTGNTCIYRNFSEDMELTVENAETIFSQYLSTPELGEIGKMISGQLGRKLEPFDIWYDGFKPRSNLDEDQLSQQTRELYPDAAAMEKQLPSILMNLGFSPDRAGYIGGKIDVDAARGSGHAWGAAMKGQQSHLRTRIPPSGMDYKGYNIAIHEFGHNVEQTLSMYDVDYYLLNGVPNTAFTEALAFVFQKRDLELLGFDDDNPEKEAWNVLDKAWTLYEIAGVSMLDIAVWKWLYEHPDATAGQLRDETIRLSKAIWNQYFAPVFGIKDQTILGVYSHMVSYPLYLSAYAFGQIIEFQLEQYLSGKDFAREVDRIYCLGRLTPNQWMIQATGSPLSVTPLLEAVREAIKVR